MYLLTTTFYISFNYCHNLFPIKLTKKYANQMKNGNAPKMCLDDQSNLTVNRKLCMFIRCKAIGPCWKLKPQGWKNKKIV